MIAWQAQGVPMRLLVHERERRQGLTLRVVDIVLTPDFDNRLAISQHFRGRFCTLMPLSGEFSDAQRAVMTANMEAIRCAT